MTTEHDFHGALPPGFDLQEYRIESVLGQGGFGITYKALDRNLNKLVAIKEYLPQAFAGRRSGTAVRVRGAARKDFEWGLGRFLQEAQTLGQFEHPNIVPVVRYFEANTTAYMVMAYQEGESLGHILDVAGTLEESELEEILHPLLDGLETVHAAGVLHRDIKPDNIFIRLADGSPVLLDFGAARQAIGARERKVTRIVTPAYAPYEQYHAGGRLGPWTNIYALAAVLYDGVAGSPPAEAPGRAAGESMQPAAEAGRGRFRPAFLQAIDRGLGLRPEDRPQTVAAWRASLPPRLDPDPPAARGRPPRASAPPPGDAMPLSPGRLVRRATELRLATAAPSPLHPGGGSLFLPTARPVAGLPAPAGKGSGESRKPQRRARRESSARPDPRKSSARPDRREPGPLRWLAAGLVVLVMAGAVSVGFGLLQPRGGPPPDTTLGAPGQDGDGRAPEGEGTVPPGTGRAGATSPRRRRARPC